MCTQIVGKVRLALTPLVNHWWNVALYMSARGLTTSPIPYNHTSFEIEFDFLDQQVVIRTETGRTRSIPLIARPVADFYREFMTTLMSLGINVRIWPMPVEVPDPIRFDTDVLHASYDPEYAGTLFQILTNIHDVLYEFRSRFLGKCSPVHFFWGSFDICETRFSGRRAPERPGADRITREAYSHECISAGFWPGSGSIQDPAFYAYAVPEPNGFADAHVFPETAHYHRELKEFILMYDDMRHTSSPSHTLLQFLQSTYEAGANLAQWDRHVLERQNAQTG
jgi:hypothetical protein